MKNLGGKMKKSILLIIVLVVFSFSVFCDEREVLKKARDLFMQGKYPEALAEIENGIKEFGSTQNLLRAKYSILMVSGKFDEAVNTAIEKDKHSEKKSPWNSYDIMMAYLKLKNYNEVIKWLEESIERGFTDYYELEGEDFKEISDNPKFQRLLSNLKEKVGIGKPANDFTVETISGKKFTLSEQKGKVVLVQFWASWCGPCRREIPNVKNCYNEFKDKGFDVIGISLDESKEDMMEYLKNEGVSWNISFSGKVWEDETAKLYGVRAIPSLWLVDRKGNLRHFGLRGDALKKAISELVAEK